MALIVTFVFCILQTGIFLIVIFISERTEKIAVCPNLHDIRQELEGLYFTQLKYLLEFAMTLLLF